MGLEKRRLTLICLSLFFIVFGPSRTHCAIYSYVDEEGVIHFTNVKPRNKEYKIVIYGTNPYEIKETGIRRNRKYDPIIYYYSRKFNIDPLLVVAMIMAESNFDPYAVSKKGAMGLMQIMPETARMLNLRNVFDPEENIRGGIMYLRLLKDYFKGDLDLVLAAYNAGPKRIIENRMAIPPIDETVNYVKKVKNLYRKLKSLNEDSR
ncbi:MAG: lytic transglycosylase domain-containing protein [Desulfobacterota bacterium]|nr:lytic transglycosylase domain-containing protein [Thermodesulfobacteriota bacterium]MDW8001733.1 transglycosylase SLT domain-containing protein [Deltaproteobacteria bacterium]